MKKLLSVFLAVVMIISCFTICAFAEENKTDALLSKVANATEMQVSIKAGDTQLGSTTETFYIKGNKAAMDWSSGFLDIRIIIINGTAYAYFKKIPFLYVKISNPSLINVDLSSLMKTAMGATSAITVFESAGEETIDNTKYYVETYNDRAEAKLKYCYIGDELKLIKVTNQTGTALESVYYTYIDNYSFTVDDSIFKVPFGIDVTPLLAGIITSLLGSAFVI